MNFKKNIILLIMAGSIFFTSCTINKNNHSVNEFPPESIFVNANGSVPPGFWETAKAAKINIDCITCNSQNHYGQFIKATADHSAVKLKNKLLPFFRDLNSTEKKHLHDELEDHIMWAVIRGVIIEGDNNNFGLHILKGKFWTDANGAKHPLVIFRGAATPSPAQANSCYRSILECANVKHVINLYDGEMDLNDLIKEERDTAASLGATYTVASKLDYGHWIDTIRKHPEKGLEREKATKKFARLIQEQILMPGGKAPQGNILIHCGGGMHRTGMVIGVLQKVINGLSMEDIKKTYSYHVGYIDEKNPGGFKQGNLDFIAEFPAQLLKN
ncbi:MAG: hypothetical protein GY710_01070 [Desulfobacteraceae bacterium]|nr:hypothetical protein [Desulfobacteraceae bacterium]